jgi:hypothetical protein
MPSNMTKYKTEGLVRVEIDLDVKAYTFLLALVEKSGYSLDLEDRQKSEGIRGVLTQGIVELYHKYIDESDVEVDDEESEDDDDEVESKSEAGLDKINQQAYIFANRMKAMGSQGVVKEDIVKTLKSKLPAYLKNHETGQLLANCKTKKLMKASRFPNLACPELTEEMEKELEAKGILKVVRMMKKLNNH